MATITSKRGASSPLSKARPTKAKPTDAEIRTEREHARIERLREARRIGGLASDELERRIETEYPKPRKSPMAWPATPKRTREEKPEKFRGAPKPMFKPTRPDAKPMEHGDICNLEALTGHELCDLAEMIILSHQLTEDINDKLHDAFNELEKEVPVDAQDGTRWMIVE